MDRLFRAQPAADDILVFRDDLAVRSPALGLAFALAAQRADGPQLVLEAVPIPLSAYSQLPLEDFMVSLYNEHTVQRIRIAQPDGGRLDAHEQLGAALTALRMSVDRA